MDVFGSSLSALLIISVILIIRRFFLKLIPKRIFVILWLIVVVKLVIPNMTFWKINIADNIQFYTVSNSAMENLNVKNALFAIWIAGAAMVALYFTYIHMKNRKRFACSLPFENGQALLVDNYNFKRKVNVRISDMTDVPLTYGILYPIIELFCLKILIVQSLNMF